MRWLVVGAGGMLTTDLVARLAGEDVRALRRGDLDITDGAAVDEALAGADVVVNGAAYTAVDAAETDEAAAFAVNATGAAHLARSASRHGARLLHVSTDYVFDGRARSPYLEDDVAEPRSAYGRTKAAGEWAVRALCDDHVIVRTAWLYGQHGTCFPRTIAGAARERGALRVVDDQVGQPTWTADLADLLVRLVEAEVPPGTYHGTSTGSVSWWGFAREVVAAAGMDPGIVTPTSSEGFTRPAPRPAYSVLGHGALRKVGVEPIGRWDERWQAAAADVLG